MQHGIYASIPFSEPSERVPDVPMRKWVIHFNFRHTNPSVCFAGAHSRRVISVTDESPCTQFESFHLICCNLITKIYMHLLTHLSSGSLTFLSSRHMLRAHIGERKRERERGADIIAFGIGAVSPRCRCAHRLVLVEIPTLRIMAV